MTIEHTHDQQQVHATKEAVAESNEKHSPSATLNHPSMKEPHFRDEEVKFSFKTRKKKEGDTTDLGQTPDKRAPVILNLPVLTFAGFLQAMQNEKVSAFVLEIVNDQIKNAARDQVSDDTTPVNSQAALDTSKLSIEFIASQPKSERTGGGISKETWEEFEADYVEIMPAVTGRTKDRIEKAAKILVQRLNPVKSDKQVLKFLKEQIDLWAGHTQNEDLAEVYQFLTNKIDILLTKDSAELLASL